MVVVAPIALPSGINPSTGEVYEVKIGTSLHPKEDDLTYNFQDLTGHDITPISIKDMNANSRKLEGKTILEEITRNNIQTLFNKIFTVIPQEKTDTGVVGVLRGHPECPKDTGIQIPRQKPVPKKKEMTRWEKFAQERGLRKKKRSKLVWDEVEQGWSRRYGYKSVKKNAEAKQWCHVVKEGADPMEDPFKKSKTEQKLTQAKQKMRELRNKVEQAGFKLGGGDLLKEVGSNSGRGKEGLREALRRSQISSASVGKFDKKAKGEKISKRGGKTKVNTAVKSSDEKAHYSKILDRMENKKNKVNVKKSTGYVQSEKEKSNKKGKKASGGGSKGAGRKGKKVRKGKK